MSPHLDIRAVPLFMTERSRGVEMKITVALSVLVTMLVAVPVSPIHAQDNSSNAQPRSLDDMPSSSARPTRSRVRISSGSTAGCRIMPRRTT